ncbi:hypothetical protein KM043_000162 [Ampulex compressa]|nr:hypothetical protein KM043_000162 [Ampulex compressa]
MSDESSANQMEDQELNDLLDSALKDFSKVSVSEQRDEEQKRLPDTSETICPNDRADPPQEDAWIKDFIKQTADQFEKNLQTFIENGGESELGACLEKAARACTAGVAGRDEVDADDTGTDFRSAIALALKDLSATSKNLQNEADLSGMLEDACSEDDAGDFLPFMRGMLQNLLSKDVLYQPLKELMEQYPEWLRKERDSLSASDLERYTKQLDLVQKVCAEFEKETDENSEEQRFDRILALMQEMQNCGHLPKELIGEQPAFLHCDATNLPPRIPGVGDSQQNCSLM